MNTQPMPELFDTTPKISGLGRRPVMASSLRPGDWLELWTGANQFTYLVLINSAKLRKLRMKSWDGTEFLISYDLLSDNYRYLGRGRERKWWFFLPKFLQQTFNRYGEPQK